MGVLKSRDMPNVDTCRQAEGHLHALEIALQTSTIDLIDVILHVIESANLVLAILASLPYM